MALPPGARLGAYEVIALIGEGGMGQVFRARDTKLNRDVALKVLPDAFASDPGRLARFTREAQTLASLNHPNIAHIHGLEESGGVRALVMELVEGEDLSQIVARYAHSATAAAAPGESPSRGAAAGGAPPAMSIDDTLAIAKQIADALEAAHEQGIIHRDLKPANIKVRPDGVVKLLDFGLAKALAPEGASTTPDAMNSPTFTSPPMTEMGMVLGTAAYMSPEQARGKVVDRRADIWAFGAVLFEMLAGKRAYPGENVTDTIVSVVSKEPDWGALPAVPPGLRRLLARCLKKDPKARLRDIGEARAQIEELLSPAPEEISAPAAAPPAPAPRSAWSSALPWAVAAAAVAGLLLVLALWAPWRAASSSQGTSLRLTPLSFEPGGQTGAVWSPKGDAVAFGARQKDTDAYQVYVRYLDSSVAAPITPPALGIPIDWTSAGKIVFRSTQQPAALWSVSPAGGEPELVLAMEGRVGSVMEAATASVSSDGTVLAWLHRGEDGAASISISSPPGAAPEPYGPRPFAARTITGGARVRFSPDGTQILLLIRSSGVGEEAWLMPYPANAATPPRQILQGLPMFGTLTSSFSWIDNRYVVVSTTPGNAPDQLYVADTKSGAFMVLSSGTTAQRFPAVSPNGRKLVFSEVTANFDVVSVDLATAVVTPVIATQRSEEMPAWAAPKASALVYVTDINGGPEIWLHKPGQPEKPLVTSRKFQSDTTRSFIGPVLSPDGTRVIYSRIDRQGATRLWVSAVADGSPVQLLKSTGTADAAEEPGSWSPEGNWFVYFSNKGGVRSLNKVKTTGLAEPEVLRADLKADLNTSGALWIPVWSPSGEWILYPDGGGKLISKDGKTMRDVPATGAVAFAFSADGQTIYGIRQVRDRTELFSMSVAGGPEKTVCRLGPEYLPAGSLNFQRLTLTPDGKSLTYSTVKRTSNLWLMEGLESVTVR